MFRIRKTKTKPEVRGTSTIALLLAAALLASSVDVASARGGGGGGGHGWGGGGPHGAHFAGGGRHGNDNYIKTASQERDKLLAKLKDICRGC